MKFKRSRNKKSHIPEPTIKRLCKIYNLLDELEVNEEKTISSKEIGQKMGAGSHSIRRDISYLGETGTTGSGYDISKLKTHISHKLGFDHERKACVIGLNQLGIAIMNYGKLTHNFRIVAGFDSNINKLETIITDIPVYPTYEILDVVKRENIELAVMTEPGHTAKKNVDRLINGGIKGIVNFSPVVLNFQNDDVFISNIDIVGEFRFLSAMFILNQMH